jgi:hypothetical protein
MGGGGPGERRERAGQADRWVGPHKRGASRRQAREWRQGRRRGPTSAAVVRSSCSRAASQYSRSACTPPTAPEAPVSAGECAGKKQLSPCTQGGVREPKAWSWAAVHSSRGQPKGAQMVPRWRRAQGGLTCVPALSGSGRWSPPAASASCSRKTCIPATKHGPDQEGRSKGD